MLTLDEVMVGGWSRVEPGGRLHFLFQKAAEELDDPELTRMWMEFQAAVRDRSVVLTELYYRKIRSYCIEIMEGRNL
jgi:hypothetical protein